MYWHDGKLYKSVKCLILCNCAHVHVVTRVVASKSRLFRLRAQIGCPTFLVYQQMQCYTVYIKNKTKYYIIFSLTCFYRIPFLTGKKIKRNAPREIRTCLLHATSPAPNPLHHSGRHCRPATCIRHSISNNLISSVCSAKTTDIRSQIKLAYATPFELQGQKNTTIYMR